MRSHFMLKRKKSKRGVGSPVHSPTLQHGSVSAVCVRRDYVVDMGKAVDTGIVVDTGKAVDTGIK